MTTATSLASPTVPSFDTLALEGLLAGILEPTWAIKRRRSAFDLLETLGLPNRRSENWMRTDIRAFKPTAWGLRKQPTSTDVAEGLLATAIASGEASTECFPDDSLKPTASDRLCGRFTSLDGHLVRAELDPAVAARGVRFGAAETILSQLPAQLEPWWFSVIDSGCDWFAALHAAFHRASVVLYVPPGVKLADPLHVLAAISPGGVDTSHVLVVLGEGAEATLLTETAGGGPVGSAGGMHCGGTEIVVGRGAFLRMVNLQNWNTGVWHFARQKAVVQEKGRLQWTLAALGSRLSQVAQEVSLTGRGAEAQVNGVMFTEGRQQLVYNTLQHHEAPACRSDLLYKGALQDRSRLVWRGMIKVDKTAQKTDGYQRNDNLMLSHESRADSIPGLEIEADDVRCTHGATNGQVDAEQIFYAQARGLTADEAARLVVAGFFQQVFDRITIPAVRDALARAVCSRIRRIA